MSKWVRTSPTTPMASPRCKGGGSAGVAERVRVTTKVELSVHVAAYASPSRVGSAGLR